MSPLSAPNANGDNRLKPVSTLRNKGDNAVLPVDFSTDVGGLPRIVGGLVDFGGYEQQ